MKILVIYDSVFGNTEQIARAIGAGISSNEGVKVLSVGDVRSEGFAGVDLLIVGSPTRGFRPTDALAGFLKNLPGNSLKGVKAAAFDTRFNVDDIESSSLRFIVKTGGYAAKRIADALKKKGAELIVEPQGFYVAGEQGPLKEGELERAAEWAVMLVNLITPTPPSTAISA